MRANIFWFESNQNPFGGAPATPWLELAFEYIFLQRFRVKTFQFDVNVMSSSGSASYSQTIPAQGELSISGVDITQNSPANEQFLALRNYPVPFGTSFIDSVFVDNQSGGEEDLARFSTNFVDLTRLPGSPSDSAKADTYVVDIRAFYSDSVGTVSFDPEPFFGSVATTVEVWFMGLFLGYCVGTPPGITGSIVVTPILYWEYRDADGLNPLYDALTGLPL